MNRPGRTVPTSRCNGPHERSPPAPSAQTSGRVRSPGSRAVTVPRRTTTHRAAGGRRRGQVPGLRQDVFVRICGRPGARPPEWPQAKAKATGRHADQRLNHWSSWTATRTRIYRSATSCTSGRAPCQAATTPALASSLAMAWKGCQTAKSCHAGISRAAPAICAGSRSEAKPPLADQDKRTGYRKVDCQVRWADDDRKHDSPSIRVRGRA